MFSNGTEAQMWQEANCWQCWKYKFDQNKTDREKCVCRTGYHIDLGYITGELPERVKKIISKSDCEYFQEKRLEYKKRKQEPMTLFEEEP